MLSRRTLLKHLSAAPFIGGLLVSGVPVNPVFAGAVKSIKRNLFKELGVRTFINATGTMTYMTGSLMRDEVVQTIMDTSDDFCMLDELEDEVGKRIAKMVHSEAAVVTSGAFSGMTLGLAGILTGMDVEKVKQLPHLEYSGMKSEVICQKSHDIVYNHALVNTGCKIMQVETIEDVENAISERTALLHFLHINSNQGKIGHEEWVALGKKYNIPTSIDIAADVPPVNNLWRFNEMGFDFVVVSGGKGLRGPQSAGILMGKKEIIAAARLHMPPRGFNIGRGMKVNKEEILGMYVALEEFLALDHEKVWKNWKAGVDHIANSVKKVDGVTTEVTVNPLGNHTPRLGIHWDEQQIKISADELREKLRQGNPSIEAGGGRGNSIGVTVWMMKPGQEKIVAKRIQEELFRASV